MSYPRQPGPTPTAPVQYPPYGQPGHYPPPGQPGHYPPPGQPGQYPPPGQPGHYPPPGQPGQYPPPGQPGHYPPPGQPGQYPPPGQPGHYPPPGQPGHYPPPGQPGIYPPPGQPYPSSGCYGPPPAVSQPGMPVPAGGGQAGWDADDSDKEDYIRSKDFKHPLRVKFINKTSQKAILYWLDEKGKVKKVDKLDSGRIEVLDTFETHPFMAELKKGPDAVINGNILFFPQAQPGCGGEIKAEITHGPKNEKALFSKPHGNPVRMKFSNRTHMYASLYEVDPQGNHVHRKDIAPKKAWLVETFEGRFFVASQKGKKKDNFDLNYGWFYLVTRPANLQTIPKVIITEPFDDSSSSSSSD